MTALDIVVLTSWFWSMICAVIILFLYGKGYKDGQDSMRTRCEDACEMWYEEGYEDGRRGRKKCVN